MRQISKKLVPNHFCSQYKNLLENNIPVRYNNEYFLIVIQRCLATAEYTEILTFFCKNFIIKLNISDKYISVEFVTYNNFDNILKPIT